VSARPGRGCVAVAAGERARQGRRAAWAWVDVDTPLGPMRLAARDGAPPHALGGAWFLDQRDLPAAGPDWRRDPGHPLLRRAAAELEDWFAGRCRRFTVRLAPEGTEFQQAVWRALSAVGFGETVSYGELARRAGRPRAVRAVAGAVGSNPISLFIPCHRIVGSDGALTGFGGGLPRKRALLALEGRHYGRADPRARETGPGLFDPPFVRGR